VPGLSRSTAARAQVPQSGRSHSRRLEAPPFFLRAVGATLQACSRLGQPEASLRRDSVLVSDEALNALLDELAAISRRDGQLAILRTWIARMMRAWDAERTDGQRETLGKLGGG
jgi:hypothetical protein